MTRGGGPVGGPQGDSDASVRPSGFRRRQPAALVWAGQWNRRVRGAQHHRSAGRIAEHRTREEQYYALTYVAPESKEGTCHALKVKVDRKGTTVRSRTSYCTEKPLDLLAGTAAAKELEQRAAAAQTGDIAASIDSPVLLHSPQRGASPRGDGDSSR